ncbi:MAG: hypothetical protein ACLFTW_07670 [Chitinispirillaceae bacterium]
MKRYIGSLFFLITALSVQSGWADISRLSSAYIFPGVYYWGSVREGYRQFDNFDSVQHLERQSLSSLGLSAGKRLPLGNGFRIQAALEAGLGTTAEDTIDGVELSDHQLYSIVQYSSFYFGGALADLHYSVPAEESSIFFSAGCGVHGTYYHESEATLDGQYSINDDQLVDAVCFSLSLSVGGGIDFLLGRHAASLVYRYRMWGPVRFREVRDLFPMGADYREVFGSHVVGVEFLLPG